MTTKQVPHNQEAEEAVLGSILISGDGITQVIPYLRPEHFMGKANSRLYKALLQLYRAGDPIDIVSLCDRLGDDLAKVGGDAYVISLMNAVPTPIHLDRYARIVHDHYIRRRMIGIAGNLAGHAYDLSKEPRASIAEIMSSVARIESSSYTRPEPIDRLAIRYTDELDSIMSSNRRPGISTGLADLDHRIGYLQKGQLVVIAGRPGMGKTSLGLQIIAHAAGLRANEKPNGAPGLIISLETPALGLLNRLACQRARVSTRRFSSGVMTDIEMQGMMRALGEMADWPISIHDRSLTSQQARAIAQTEVVERGVGLIFYDHIQLSANEGTNETERWARVSQDLKGLAVDMDVVVIAASQLSRQPERRDNRRPTLSDLRGSGAIEQNADIVLGLYCEDYYAQQKARWTAPKGTAEILVLKHRDGSRGRVDVKWTPEHVIFDNLEVARASEDAEPEDIPF